MFIKSWSPSGDFLISARIWISDSFWWRCDVWPWRKRHFYAKDSHRVLWREAALPRFTTYSFWLINRRVIKTSFLSRARLTMVSILLGCFQFLIFIQIIKINFAKILKIPICSEESPDFRLQVDGQPSFSPNVEPQLRILLRRFNEFIFYRYLLSAPSTSSPCRARVGKISNNQASPYVRWFAGFLSPPSVGGWCELFSFASPHFFSAREQKKIERRDLWKSGNEALWLHIEIRSRNSAINGSN